MAEGEGNTKKRKSIRHAFGLVKGLLIKQDSRYTHVRYESGGWREEDSMFLESMCLYGVTVDRDKFSGHAKMDAVLKEALWDWAVKQHGQEWAEETYRYCKYRGDRQREMAKIKENHLTSTVK